MDNQLSTLVGVAHSGFTIYAGSPFLTDSAGDIFTLTQNLSLTKYSPSFALVWTYSLNSIPGVSLILSTISTTSDGGVCFGGSASAALSGEPYGGSTDAVVGKLTAAGTLAWIHQLGSSGAEQTNHTVGLPDGSVIAGGASTGQLPGKPSTVLGGAWLVRYEADGTRTWLQQYAKTSLTGGGLFNSAGSPTGDGQFTLDASGNVTIVGGNKLAKIDVSQGTVLGEFTKAPLTSPLANYVTSYLPFGMGSDRFYTWTNFYYSTVTSTSTQYMSFAFAKFSLDGVLLSYREFEPARTAVIDAVENVIWTGKFTADSGVNQRIAVASDAVYLTGLYTNSYMNGSIARPTTKNLFVGKYSLSGDRVWFQEFSFQGDTANTLSSIPLGMVLDPSGNPVLGVYQGPTAGFIFKLSAAEGTVM